MEEEIITVKRSREISQAITIFDDQQPELFTLQPLENKVLYERYGMGSGIINAIYFYTDLDIMNFEFTTQEQNGINNCPLDMWRVQGRKVRDNGILFCSCFKTKSYNIIYESSYGMRFDDGFKITAKNLSETKVGKVLGLVILYSTVC